MYFFIVTDSIQTKGAHNRVVSLIAIFHGCSPQTEFSFPGMTPYSFSRLQLLTFQRNLFSPPILQMETTFSYDMPQCDELEDSLTPLYSTTVHDLRNTNTRAHLPTDTTVQCLVLS